MLYEPLVVLALTGLVASGCGGSSKTTSQGTTSASSATSAQATTPISPAVKIASGNPLTRVQWLTQGDAICARLNAQLNASTIGSASQFAVVLPKAAAYESAELDQLLKLVPPPADTNDWRTFLKETRTWADNSAKLGQLARIGRFAQAGPLISTTKTIHEHLAHRAGRDGFKECSQV